MSKPKSFLENKGLYVERRTEYVNGEKKSDTIEIRKKFNDVGGYLYIADSVIKLMPEDIPALVEALTSKLN